MFFVLCAVCVFSSAQSQTPYFRTSQAVSYSSGPGTIFYSSTGGSSQSSFDSGPSGSASQSVSYGDGVGSQSAITYSRPEGSLRSFIYTGTSSADGTEPISPTLPPISFYVHSLFPQLTSNYVSLFARSFFQLVKTSSVLNQPNDLVIDNPVIYRVAKIILERDGVIDPILQQLATQSRKRTTVYTYDLYVKALALTLAKLLYLNGILTQEAASTYPELALGFVEDYARKHGVSDIESVFRAVTKGTVDFANSKGLFSRISDHILSFQLFVQERIALTNGAEF